MTYLMILLVAGFITFMAYLISKIPQSQPTSHPINQLPQTPQDMPNKRLIEAAQRYKELTNNFIDSSTPLTTQQAIDMLNTLYVNYVNDLDPYRVIHLDFYEFTIQHSATHLFHQQYSSHVQEYKHLNETPLSFREFILLQTP